MKKNQNTTKPATCALETKELMAEQILNMRVAMFLIMISLRFKNEVSFDLQQEDLFKINPERGINRVICFSPKHNVTLAEMQIPEIENVIKVWKEQYLELGAIDYINHVQIFENKGSVMGCSNPHPHGQIWAQSSLPTQVKKTQDNLLKYYQKTGKVF
jgi:UDPglucose--hexose-1-phosphate uridylyltransferase